MNGPAFQVAKDAKVLDQRARRTMLANAPQEQSGKTQHVVG
jgi:hypothetical protein